MVLIGCRDCQEVGAKTVNVRAQNPFAGKVPEEMRVPISCVGGTSMGSLIGSVYAAGVSTDAMTETLSEIDWDAIFTDDPPRTEKPLRAKRNDDYENLSRLEL